MALTDQERERLVASLVNTLLPDAEVSDEEVLQRDAALESGRAEELSHEDFVQLVRQSRSR